MLEKRKNNNFWIIKNQKGLSAIVSTLIIILLVLVAVGIVWVVVKSIVEEGAEGIGLGRFTLDLEIKRAQIENGDVTVVVVRRNPGQGNYIGMNFVFSDGTNSEIIRENTTLQELEERSFTFTLTEISTNNLTTISVAPIFELSSGEESVGNIADSFEVTEEMKAGITDGAISNFEMLGFSGMEVVNYSISSSGEILPKFKRAIVDPLDVSLGDNQTFTAYVYSPYGIINVTTTTQLDNSTLNLDLEKIDEYVENNETIEIWSANWIVYDTHVTTYRTTIIATDSEGNENNITLTWTDACTGITHGQDSTLSTQCSLGASETNGLDGGSLTIGSGGNLQITGANSIWAFNDGKSITMSGGSITISGGSIKKGNLFYTDVDEDNYAPDTVMTFDTSSSLPNKIRASSGSLLGTNDCNDANSGDWILKYTDSDGDTHCPNSATTCVGNDAGYRSSCTRYDDCCDSDVDAYVGQTSYFTTQRGCGGGWDYNCDTWEIKQWTAAGTCFFCYADFETQDCVPVSGGISGWKVPVPACGDSGNYLIDAGISCPSRDYGDCKVNCLGAQEGSRTQACR